MARKKYMLGRYPAALRRLARAATEVQRALQGVSYCPSEDGRLNSALLERHVIGALGMDRTAPRAWADFFWEGYPINLKLTTAAGRDNVFNKKGLLYSLTTLSADDIPDRMTMGQFAEMIRNPTITKRERDYHEYYYLVMHKHGEYEHPILVSALDVQHYFATPGAILQVDWRLEWQRLRHGPYADCNEVISVGCKRDHLDDLIRKACLAEMGRARAFLEC